MSPVMPIGRLKRLLAVWLLVVFGVLVVVAANGHLVYVAISSQPDCVAHVRRGESVGTEDRFSAARSSCTP